ncbi:lactonase family protein [Lutibacter sp. HS1-25]|uniref:lactonase family protein n=1 Tax=Lutibacter sp. HS1-25 TaxID=2485000 RepID=UPI0010130083|nr:lactonase family protein [Lutibacter sp. HS1-25]RXP54278.1 lactonase family protein [Lutibacter sp. HS1-25]
MKTFFSFLFMLITQLISAQNIPLYVGTYNGENSEGIYYYDFNTKTGELTNQKLAIKTTNPSFIAYSENRKFIYAVSEASDGSLVSAYAVNKNGTLSLINSATTNGKGPCHVQLNKAGTKVVVSNYVGGTVSLHTVKKNGSINNAFQVMNHNTDSVKSHAHSAKFLNNDLFVADLGRDFLAHYVEKDNQFVLKENYTMAAGAGPRHFEISKNGDYIYVINELNSTVSVLKSNGKNYSNIQNIGTLRADYEGKNACADIHLSKDEAFLYGSNRGENSIVVFKRNTKNGTLEKIQNISVEGDWPRNFTLSPNGDFLLVANRRSSNISIYYVDKTSGKLTYKNSIEAPIPVCLLF